ncbi:MAG TPA: YceI family protein [Thermoleophilaceae bacterium]|nr:YceI family protein [Thermoleophilaceae bacterium]
MQAVSRANAGSDMISTAKTTLVPTGTWSVDPSHSTVGFSVKHLGIATVRGKFEQFEGKLEIGEDLSSARASGTVQGASINTNDAGRDEHLRSADFFGIEANPELRFESTAIRALDEDTFEIEGELSMNGVTGPVTLKAEVQGTETDPWGNERVGLEVTGQLNRTDWNMTFNQALGSGNLLVGEKVKLDLDISAVKQA